MSDSLLAEGNVRLGWAPLTVWLVVNAVNVLQSAGFISRVITRSMAINHALGYVILALGIPSALALGALLYGRVPWLEWIGPAAFLCFIAFMVFVDYILSIDFRSPGRSDILVPYLVLFFGSIILMGLPMFRLNRNLWFVTVATSLLLIASMALAMLRGMS